MAQRNRAAKLLILMYVTVLLPAPACLMAAEVRHSLKPLDLSRAPDTEELMAAGQLGGKLFPTEDLSGEGKQGNKAVC